jgi:hypothetical protein
MAKYLRGAASIGLDTKIKDLRRTTSAAAGNGLGTTAMSLRRTTSCTVGNGRAKRPSTCAAPRASF